MKNRAAIIVKQFEIVHNTYSLDLYILRTIKQTYSSKLLKSIKLKRNDDLEEKKESLKSLLKEMNIKLEPIYYETKLICGMALHELLKISRGQNIG